MTKQIQKISSYSAARSCNISRGNLQKILNIRIQDDNEPDGIDNTTHNTFANVSDLGDNSSRYVKE
jgi:hypothetical protein